jgi:hypothetical protein
MGRGQVFWTSALAAYAVFSLAYIVFDQWQDYRSALLDSRRDEVVRSAMQQGRDAVLKQFIGLALKCKPIDVEDEQAKIQLIDPSCLGNRKPATP